MGRFQDGNGRLTARDLGAERGALAAALEADQLAHARVQPDPQPAVQEVSAHEPDEPVAPQRADTLLCRHRSQRMQCAAVEQRRCAGAASFASTGRHIT